MPDTHHDKCHESNGAILAKDIDQYLQHRLASLAVDGAFEVLDREKQGDEKEETKNSRTPDRHQDTNRSIPRSIGRLL